MTAKKASAAGQAAGREFATAFSAKQAGVFSIAELVQKRDTLIAELAAVRAEIAARHGEE